MLVSVSPLVIVWQTAKPVTDKNVKQNEVNDANEVDQESEKIKSEKIKNENETTSFTSSPHFQIQDYR